MKSFNMLLVSLLSPALALSLTACQSSAPTNTSGQSPTVSVPTTDTANTTNAQRAPWSNAAINNGATDAVYRQEWLKAESRALCPILALPKQSSAHLSAHSVRRANFASGWGVAYDLPDLRSAYGVANASTVDPNDLSYSWPYNTSYQDGSTVGYGHEGGDPTAKWLAYIVLPQNNCFYNVWSAQGKDHLEQMIADLRLVNP